jgi:hypothetical protein
LTVLKKVENSRQGVKIVKVNMLRKMIFFASWRENKVFIISSDISLHEEACQSNLHQTMPQMMAESLVPCDGSREI